jgi:hypothetical protein
MVNKPDLYPNSDWGEFENELWALEQAQSANTPQSRPAPQRGQKKDRYVRTIPLVWITRACAIPGKALALALCLWYRSGLEGSKTVCLSHKRLEEFRLSRQAMRRLLPLFEERGLVSVARGDYQAPVVTILDVKDE